MVDVQPLLPDEPDRVGEFELTGRLAAGRRGEVYLGRSPAGGLVAVRLLTSSWITATGGRTALARRLIAARRVHSRWVARILDAQVGGGTPYMVTDFVDGPTLLQVVRQHGPVHAAALEQLAISTAAGLAAVHGVGLAHGELTPSTILIGPTGPCLIDLGLSSGGVSRGWMAAAAAFARPSPGRALARAGAGPDDVYAWAAAMSFAATGWAPFLGESPVPTGDAVLATAGDPCWPGGLRDVVRDCLQRDPALRPNAEQVLARLATAADRLPVSAVARARSTRTRSARAGSSAGPLIGRLVGHAGRASDAQTVTETIAEPTRGGVGPEPVSTRVVSEPVSGRVIPEPATGGAAFRPSPRRRLFPDPTPTPRFGVGAAAPTPPDGSGERSPRDAGRRSLQGRMRPAAFAVLALLGATVGSALGAGGVQRLLAAPAAPAVGYATVGAGAPTAAAAAPAGAGAASAGAGAADAGVTGSCAARYQVVEQWPGGFKAEVTVVAGDAPLSAWRVRWSFGGGQAVTQWWNVDVTTGGSSVVARNASWNGKVEAHGTTTFGFLGSYQGANPKPSVSCSSG